MPAKSEQSWTWPGVDAQRRLTFFLVDAIRGVFFEMVRAKRGAGNIHSHNSSSSGDDEASRDRKRAKEGEPSSTPSKKSADKKAGSRGKSVEVVDGRRVVATGAERCRAPLTEREEDLMFQWLAQNPVAASTGRRDQEVREELLAAQARKLEEECGVLYTTDQLSTWVNSARHRMTDTNRIAKACRDQGIQFDPAGHPGVTRKMARAWRGLAFLRPPLATRTPVSSNIFVIYFQY